MKKFLIKTLIFCALLITFGFATEYVVDTVFRKIKNIITSSAELVYFQLWNDIFESKVNADVVAVGNSRTWVNINPYILDSILGVNSYNLGLNAQPFPMQYVRFELLKQYNTKPKLVIQNVDCFTFNRNKLSVPDNTFLPFTHIKPIRNELRQSGVFAALYIPAFKYRGKIQFIKQGVQYFCKKELGNTDEAGIYKGFFNKNTAWDDSELNNQLKSGKMNSAKNPEVLTMFDNYLNECKADNIFVVLVRVPMYYKAYEMFSDNEEMTELYCSFAAKYGFTFLDYSEHFLCSDTAYFYNASHLNLAGANIFTAQLANDIDELGVLKP
ncbi:MAG: hypothetical protein LBN23_03555 [Paludibacter sp.]|jgi:hypothetical protein|nr:hypothetical protein [Paludibacter sp.]